MTTLRYPTERSAEDDFDIFNYDEDDFTVVAAGQWEDGNQIILLEEGGGVSRVSSYHIDPTTLNATRIPGWSNWLDGPATAQAALTVGGNNVFLINNNRAWGYVYNTDGLIRICQELDGELLTPVDFELDDANSDVEGAYGQDGIAYIVDDTEEKFFAYVPGRDTGAREASRDWDLAVPNSHPSAVCKIDNYPTDSQYTVFAVSYTHLTLPTILRV